MSNKVGVGEMLSYSLRAAAWRPVHMGAVFLVLCALYYAYYSWTGSAAGQAFFRGYLEATMSPDLEDLSEYTRYMSFVQFGSIVAGVIMYSAVYRVLVRTSGNPLLPIQIGVDELRVFVVMVAVYMIFVGVMLAFVIAAALVIGVLAMIAAGLGAAGGGSQEGAIMGIFVILIGLAAFIAAFVGIAYIAGRIGVSLPMTIRQRRITLGGWPASKDYGWSLVGAHCVIYFVLMLVMGLLMAGSLGVLLFSGELSDPTSDAYMDMMLTLMGNPYGNMVWLAVPIQVALTIWMLGPTAAVAMTVEEAPAPVPPSGTDEGAG